MNLTATIAALRRARGMTQEALAERIGVAAQTISKWETGATCPDVGMLPVLADVFGVTVDALYGREDARRCTNAAEAVDQVLEAVRETIAATVYRPETDGRFEDQLRQYKKVMQADPRQRSVIENDREVLYFREQTGALALRRPSEGWSSLLGQQENQAVLRLLAEDDFRRAMQVIISRRMLSFTVPSLAKAAAVREPDRLEALLQTSGLFARRTLMIDEAPLVYYELTQGETRLYLLYAVLLFAQEFAGYEPLHYCFIGNSRYFTP